jgi:hypothetical protein
MRFEARHKFFKHVAKIGSNFKNISKTVSNRNQLLLSYKLLKNKEFLVNEIENFHNSQCRVEELKMKETLCQLEDFAFESDIMTFKSIKFNGNFIEINNFVLLNWMDKEDMPVFAKVELIYKKEGNYRILSQKLKTFHFIHHYHAYSVEQLDSYFVHDLDQFDLLKPLLSKSKENLILIKLPFICC